VWAPKTVQLLIRHPTIQTMDAMLTANRLLTCTQSVDRRGSQHSPLPCSPLQCRKQVACWCCCEACRPPYCSMRFLYEATLRSIHAMAHDLLLHPAHTRQEWHWQSPQHDAIGHSVLVVARHVLACDDGHSPDDDADHPNQLVCARTGGQVVQILIAARTAHAATAARVTHPNNSRYAGL
jgi:hypothetical protein